MYNIGFVGKGGSGKSYLCRYLIQKYNYVAGKMACSLYGIAKQYFGMDEKNKDRRLLQYMGTDIGRREVNDQIWVNRFKEDLHIVQRTYKDLYNKEIAFCSDDVRFENEFNALTEMGWVMIYLNVPDDLRKARLISRDGDAQEGTLGHVSEMEMDKFKDQCYQLDSSGSLEQTYERLDNLLEYVYRERNVEKTI